jgi:hypothetical protein
MAGVWNRLGKMLVADGVVTQEALERALQAQALHGGRLGTNLVDLDLLGIEEVATYLSLQLGVPPVGPTDLSVALPEVVSLLAPEHCARHKVVPLACNGRLLKLAMLDPRDQATQNEIGLLTQTRVIPYVAPELLLLQALEKRYGIRRERRFLRAPQQGDLPQEAVPAPDKKPDLPEPPRRRSAISLLLPATDLPPAAEQPVGLAEELDLEDEDEYIDSDVTTQWSRPTADLLDLDAALSSLRRVADREAVVNHLIRCFHGGTTCVLFMLRGPLAVANLASETALSREELENLILPTSTPSLIEQALGTGAVVRGFAGSDPLQQVIARHLGWPDPGEVCVAPVKHEGQVINLLCVQTPARVGFSDEFPAELGRLCDEAGQSYGRLVKTHVQSPDEELIPIEAEEPPEPVPEPERPTLYDTRFFVTGLAFTRSTTSVWRAVDTSAQKIVAIHVALPGVLEIDEVQQLTQEALELQKLSHPSLPKHLGAGITEQGHAYVVTEWLDGVDLRAKLEADPVPPRADVASVVSGVCGVLEQAHGAGVFHRHITPENVMLAGPRRQIKLTGFGFVRDPTLHAPASPAPEEDRLYGAKHYRAPEVTAGQRGAAPADVYAVGVIAFEMLVGRRPRGPVEPIDLATLPSTARKLLTQTLSPEPENRPAVVTLGKKLASALRGPAQAKIP